MEGECNSRLHKEAKLPQLDAQQLYYRQQLILVHIGSSIVLYCPNCQIAKISLIVKIAKFP